jgi:hypothetical protein
MPTGAEGRFYGVVSGGFSTTRAYLCTVCTSDPYIAIIGALLSSWRDERQKDLTWLPAFPVRAGIAAVRHGRETVIQRAYELDGRVVIELRRVDYPDSPETCRQTWAPGAAWWEHLVLDSSCPIKGPWQRWLGWDTGPAQAYTLEAERVNAAPGLPTARELEREAVGHLYPDGDEGRELAPLVAKRLPELFTGDQLTWKLKAWRLDRENGARTTAERSGAEGTGGSGRGPGCGPGRGTQAAGSGTSRERPVPPR